MITDRLDTLAKLRASGAEVSSAQYELEKMLAIKEDKIERLEKALWTIAQFRGQLQPQHFGIDNNLATVVAIAEHALGRDQE